MKTIKYLVVWFLTAFLVLTGCGKGTNEAVYDAVLAEEAYKMAPEMMQNRFASDAGGNAVEEIERKLIKTGNLTFETKNIDSSKRIITAAVEKYNGYISSDDNYTSPDRISGTLVIRIPDDSFDSFIIDATSGVKRFDNRSVNVSDVTEQFIDINARLNTKKELEKRLLELLDNTSSVSEIIEIEKQLGDLRSEIESIEGRLKYLENQVSYSTVSITFYERLSADNNIFGKIGDSIKGGWNLLISFIMFLVRMWPFILILAGVIFLWRRIRK